MTALANWHGLQADPDNLPLPRPGVYRTEHIASGRSHVGASQNVKALVRSHVAGSCCGGSCCGAAAQKLWKIRTVAALRLRRVGRPSAREWPDHRGPAEVTRLGWVPGRGELPIRGPMIWVAVLD
jgi:hypothetical protein